MEKRKISECVNVRINIGNYQHIEITKYAEEEIEFSSASERIQKEEALTDDLTQSLIRSMKAIPERLAKGVDQAVEVQALIKKAIPEWLANSPVPNIANNAKKNEIKADADAKSNKDEAVARVKEVDLMENDVAPVPSQAPAHETNEKNEAEANELFDDGATNTSVKKSDNDDLFGDDDIFGDK
jgi:hypothetical protein